jgi:hypothetical protein
MARAGSASLRRACFRREASSNLQKAPPESKAACSHASARSLVGLKAEPRGPRQDLAAAASAIERRLPPGMSLVRRDGGRISRGVWIVPGSPMPIAGIDRYLSALTNRCNLTSAFRYTHTRAGGMFIQMRSEASAEKPPSCLGSGEATA